jgi:Ser/Thr protein kinase RdoA (MazF antagonist)
MSEIDDALAAWGATGARLIKGRENAVYEAALPGGRAALRLHRVGYQTRAAIASELDWMRGLAAGGLRVPAPILALSGEDVVELSSGRLATVVSWVEGAPLGAGGEPLEGPLAVQLARFRAVGREVARLHTISDGLTFGTDFGRHAWDIDGLLGEAPLWGPFWENPALTGDERALVLEAREKARAALVDFQARGGDFGLIHADVLRENVLVAGETVTLIDFDDAGWGFRLYDLATLMTQNEEEPDHPALRDAALAGYREERALSEEDAELLAVFVMLRRFASMGWIVSRVRPGEAWVRIYAERAVAAARGFLEAG